MLQAINKSLLLACCLFLVSSVVIAAYSSDFQKGKTAYQKKDYTEAFYHFRSAAEAGNAEAQLYLGSMYRNDDEGIKRDTEKMFFWWNKAADQGNARAAYAVAKWSNGDFGEMVWKDDDYSKLIPLYERAAKLGDSLSQYWLGRVYRSEQTIHADPKLHHYWMEKAAENNSTQAQFRIAEIYGQGIGVMQDNQKSLMWLKKAAQSQHPKAQFHLARLNFMGAMGVTKNPEQGLAWMQAAAINGEKTAYYELAMRHITGDGAEKDPKKGYLYFIELMRKADDKDLRAKVSFKMGEIFALGGFGKTDPVAAYSWFYVANKKGNPEAPKAMAFVRDKNKMSTSDWVAAEQRARRCLETNYEICRPRTEQEIAAEKAAIKALWEAMRPEKSKN